MVGIADIEAAILSDEIGVDYARYAGHVLRSAYQPIFAYEGSLLRPAMVEGRVWAYRDGVALPSGNLFGDTPLADRWVVEALGRALHIGNHFHLGAPLPLLVKFELAAPQVVELSLEGLRRAVARNERAGLAPVSLVCAISEDDGEDVGLAARVAEVLRSAGIRIAIADFGGGQRAARLVERMRPSLVQLDGPWFRMISDHSRAAKLLSPLVQSVKQNGASVIASGIETRRQLDAAIESGVDFLQGYFLARPALAASGRDFGPLELASFGGGANIVPLFPGPAQRNHQRG